jgi:hypothetical protein
MLSIVILVLIGVALVFHRYLSMFWEQGRLPYVFGFLSFNRLLILIYATNFIWMFGWLVGIVFVALTILDLIYGALLWPFLLLWSINADKKETETPVNQLVYGGWSFIILGIGILTIVNFIVSHYKHLYVEIMGSFALNPFSFAGLIIAVIIGGNLLREINMRIMTRL